jgi:hypothetical protein
MPGAGAAVVASAIAATTVTVTAGVVAFSFSMATFAFTLAASLALGAISSALQSKPNTSQSNSANSSPLATIAKDRTLTFRQPITSHRIIYGECRVAGPLTFIESTDDNANLHQLITLAGHQVQEIGELWVNDAKVTLDGSNQVSSGDFSGSHITVLKGDGSAGDDAALLSALTSAASGWTANHKQLLRAKLYVKFAHDPDIFIGQLPSISALVKGKLIYDTRDAGTRYSNNPALIIYDYLTDTSTGIGELAARINTASFTTAANICDEDVSVVLSRTFTTTHATELLTLSSAASGMRTGDKARVSNSGGALPTGFSASTDYFWISVNSTTGYLATTKANAIAGTKVTISDDGSGTHTIKRRAIETFTADASTEIITIANKIKDLLTGDGVEVSSTGTEPAGLSPSTTYYWSRLTDTTGYLCTTRLNALAGTAINITDTGSGTHSIERTVEPRFACNGTVDTAQTPKEIISQLLTSMSGSLVYQTGQWSLYAGAYRTPTITITEDSIVGEIQIVTKVTRKQIFNGVKGVFVSPTDNYQPTDFPAVTNATYLAEDQAERLWKDVDLMYTVSPAMAQRISKIDLERARQQITVNLSTNLMGLQLQAGDTVQLTNSRMGWTAKVFDVIDWALAVQPDAGGNPALVCGLKLRETASTVYDWDGGEETVTDLAPNTTLPDAFTVTPPPVPSVVDALYETKDGSGVKAKATVSWAVSTDAFVSQYLMEYKLTTNSTWIENPRTNSTTQDILDIDPGIYDFRVFAYNSIGVKSAASTTKTQEITGLGAVPTAPQNLTISAIGGLAVLRWDQSTDLDVKIGGKIEIRHDDLLTGAALSTSVTIGQSLDGRTTVAILPLKSGTYLVRMIDTSNLKSAVASVSTKQATIITISGLSSIVEHSGFAGAKSGVILDGVNLKLAGSDNIDSWTDIDTVANWDSEGGVLSTGTYTFTNSFDFGSVVSKRLTTVITVLISNVLDLIDARSTNIDTWEDFNGTAGSDADARVYVRHTDDDPAGAPSWTEWGLLESAEFEARAFQFKCVLTTGDPAYNISVSELTINSADGV